MNRLTEEQRNWLDDLGIFRELPQETRSLIAAAAETTLFKLGEVVVREGESAESFFVVERGKARVVTEGDDGRKVTLATLEPGDSFGEQSLLFERPAGATVRAATGLLLIAIPADTFRRVAQTHPAFRKQLEARIRQHSEFNLLRKLNVLSSLSLKDAQELATSIVRVELTPGDVLFHEGDEADAAYSIVDGRIRILKESANNTLMAVLGPGALIGEMALLHDAPRSAAAVAAGEQKVQLLRLDREEFLRIVSSKDAEQVLVKQASNRLQQQQSFLDDITEVRERETAASPSIQVAQIRLPGRWTRRGFRSYRHARTDHEHLAGIAALTAIDRFYRQEHNPESLIREQLASGSADDLESVSRKAEAWGYLTRLVSLKPGQLDQIRVPALVQTVNGSILVLHAIDADGVVVADPLGKVGRIPRASFMERWSGRALLLSYVPSFAEVGRDVRGTLRRLMPMVLPYRDLLFWILGLSTMVQLTTLAIPLFTKVIIDDVLVHGDRSLLVLMLVGIVVITAFQLLGQTLTGLLQTYGLRQVGASVVLRFFDHVLSIPYSISARWRAADFISRFAENEKLLTMAAQTGFGVLVSTTTSIVYIGALVSQSGQLTAIALLFVAAYAVLVLVATPRLRENDRAVYRRKEDVQAYLIELVGGISTVKGLAAEDDFQAKGMRRVADLMQAEFRGARLGFNIDLISKLLSQASTIVVLGYGAVLVLKGAMTAGGLVAFNAMLGLLVGTLTKLISSWDELQEMRVSFERVGDVLSLPVESRGAIHRLPPLSGRVRFEGVRFRYDEGEADVLAGIDLEVLPGQKIALVGRSGSGKTTLANLVIKLLEPTEGRILIDGMDLAHMDVSALRAQIGVIEQSPYLFSGTVRENIARTNPTADFESVVAAATLAGAHEFIEALPLKYDTQVGERGSNLSGGQRQRLVIARALLNNPAILVMDEATSALDTETERSIQRNIDEVMAGRTVFTIAHRLSTVQNADRIVVVDGGQIRESGTHDELMERRGLYYYFHRQPEEALAA